MCVYCALAREGRTSIAVNVEAWALRGRIGERVKVTEGLFTFVAIDQEGRPRPLPAPPPGAIHEQKTDASTT
jgi:acyl-CoA thioesterase YciA